MGSATLTPVETWRYTFSLTEVESCLSIMMIKVTATATLLLSLSVFHSEAGSLYRTKRSPQFLPQPSGDWSLSWGGGLQLCQRLCQPVRREVHRQLCVQRSPGDWTGLLPGTGWRSYSEHFWRKPMRKEIVFST